jgi:hypothetical protein
MNMNISHPWGLPGSAPPGPQVPAGMSFSEPHSYCRKTALAPKGIRGYSEPNMSDHGQVAMTPEQGFG